LEAAQEASGITEEGSEILGVHLEGPHLNPRRAGAQNPEYLLPPSPRVMEELLDRFPGLVAWVTVAPELAGARELIELLHRRGVVVAAGHTDATYEQAVESFQWGVRHTTHTFNVMNSPHHRPPSVPDAALASPSVTAERIVGGFRFHPLIVRPLWHSKA